MSDCSRTVDDLKNLLHSSKDFDAQQTAKFYDDWAETYEQDCHTVDYTAPHQAVDFLSHNFSGNPKDIQVLDVACGSGWIAKLMAEHGFKNFVGVDGSKGMLEQAAKTGLYQDLKLALLGTDPLPAEPGTFDLVIIVGALREGFVPVSVIRELCHAAKPGGYICMSRIDPKSESGNNFKVCMENELQLMEKDGLWTHVATKEMDRYVMDYDNYSKAMPNEQYIYGTMYMYRKSLN